MRYAIVTFGCRVNQADSLRLEEDLRAPAAASRPPRATPTWSSSTPARSPRRRTRARARPSAASPAKIPTRRSWPPAATRRAAKTKSPRCPASCGSSATTTSWIWCTCWTPRSWARPSGRAISPPPWNGDGPCGSSIEPGVAGRTAFTIRAQTGCEERCAYCIIPTTRGASRSRPVDGSRARDRARRGRRLQGSHARPASTSARTAATWRRASSLLALLRALDAIDGDVTFRVSSLEPMDCTPEIVALVVAQRPLPAALPPAAAARQRSACSPRCAARTRSTSTAGLVDGIVARLPHASIGSDMIVGFPGETDDDFAANLAYLPSSPLTHLHVFPYSDRPGTEASAMRDKVHGTGRPRARRRAARHRRGAGRALPRVTGRDTVRPGADARGRHAGGDGQLSEGENSARDAAQHPGDGPHTEPRRA